MVSVRTVSSGSEKDCFNPRRSLYLKDNQEKKKLGINPSEANPLIDPQFRTQPSLLH